MYRFMDHTADIAFEVEAESLEELLRDSTLAFYSAFSYTEKLGDSETRDIEIHGESPDDLLFSWLNELLFIFDAYHFAGKDVNVMINEGEFFEAKGVIKGDKLSPEKVKLEPKAITLHNFKVEKTEKGWRAFVVIDI